MIIILPEIIKDIEDRVLDMGDTMTGTLSINKGVNFNQLYFYDKNNNRYVIHCGSEIESSDYADFQLQLTTDVGRSLLTLRNTKSTGDNPYLFIYNEIDGVATSYQVLTQLNYNKYALPLTGGTVTGNVNFKSSINSMVAIHEDEIVTSGTTSGERNTLLIYGPTYGNTASQIKNAGRLTWGDPSPQIVFNIKNSLTEGQPLALMYTDNNTIGFGTSLCLTTSESSCGFIAPYIRATTQLQVVRYDENPAKGTLLPVFNIQYQNGAGVYYTTDLITAVGTGNTDNNYNASFLIGSRNGCTTIGAGESCGPMVTSLGLADTEHIYFVTDGSIYSYVGCSNDASSYTLAQSITSSKITAHVPLYGAVWNDYAEYRQSNILEPGRVVIETGEGDLILATERLQAGANVISDTFGFAIGETEECQCPLAVSGRVLAYPYEPRGDYKAGEPVCSGPNGTISKMSREEVQKYPDRIIGTVSEIPKYERWGSGNVEVNGRIWIKVI